MNFDNSVKTAFIISVIFHSVIFFSPALLGRFIVVEKPPAPMEITYYSIKPRHSISHKAVPKPRLKSVTAPEQKAPPQAQEVKKAEPLPQAPEMSSVVPANPAGLEKTPAYISYAQSVRGKINSVANSQAYRRPRSSGDVFLNFVLLSDGQLAALQIVNERSCQNQWLKEAGRKVIEASSPFDPFPADLEFNQLAFSVVISFE